MRNLQEQLGVLLPGAEKLGLRLNTKQIELFHLYESELLSWNQHINLTGVKSPSQIQSKHFLESIAAYNLILTTLPNVSSLLDLGSGAGFPGIPLKILLEDIDLCLVESINKKADFLKKVISVLNLQDVTILADRSEIIAKDSRYREVYDIVTSRAVARLDTLLELALPLTKVGGYFVAFKKPDIEQEINEAMPALEILGGKIHCIENISIQDILEPTSFIFFEKIMPSPDLYPRRPGIPRKRPLS